MIQPPSLKPGDTVAFLAPAGGLAALAPHRLRRAQRWWKDQGFQVEILPTARQNETPHSSAPPQERARDLMDAFRNQQIRAAIATIGGTTANQILEYLDFQTLARHPTIFCGYSDMTNIHAALQSQANMISFYGPAVITQFGEWPEPPTYTANHFSQATGQPEPRGPIAPSPQWTQDKNFDYLEQTDTGYERVYRANPGYRWLREGRARGVLLGGCLTSLMNLRGTQYMPDLEGALLVLETPEGEDYRKGVDLGRVEACLTNLRIDGTYSKISGLIVGRGFGYDRQERQLLRKLVGQATRDFDFPILCEVDVGHTDPVTTLPLGAQAELDSSRNRWAILEAGVAPRP